MTTQAINGFNFYKCNWTFTRFHADLPWSKNALQIPSWRQAGPSVELFGLLKESGEQEKTLTSTERTYNLHLCFPPFQKSSEPKWRTERVKISQHWLKGPRGIKHTVCMVAPVIEDWGLAHNIRNMENWSRFPSDVGHWFGLIDGNSFHQAERSSEV